MVGASVDSRQRLATAKQSLQPVATPVTGTAQFWLVMSLRAKGEVIWWLIILTV